MQLRGMKEKPSRVSCAGQALSRGREGTFDEAGWWRQAAPKAEMACTEGALVVVCPERGRGEVVEVGVRLARPGAR